LALLSEEKRDDGKNKQQRQIKTHARLEFIKKFFIQKSTPRLRFIQYGLHVQSNRYYIISNPRFLYNRLNHGAFTGHNGLKAGKYYLLSYLRRRTDAVKTGRVAAFLCLEEMNESNYHGRRRRNPPEAGEL
jgi:hypothetical protein